MVAAARAEHRLRVGAGIPSCRSARRSALQARRRRRHATVAALPFVDPARRSRSRERLRSASIARSSTTTELAAISEEASREMVALLAAELEGGAAASRSASGPARRAPARGGRRADGGPRPLGADAREARGEGRRPAAVPARRRRRDDAAVRRRPIRGALVRHVLHLVPAWRRAVAELVRVVHVRGGVLVVDRATSPRPGARSTDRFVEIARAVPPCRRARHRRRARSVGDRSGRSRREPQGAPADHRTGPADARRVPRPDGGRAALVDVGGGRADAQEGRRRGSRVGARALRLARLRPVRATSPIEWRAYDLP